MGLRETVRRKSLLVCSENLPLPGAKLRFIGFQVARSMRCGPSTLGLGADFTERPGLLGAGDPGHS